MRLFPNEMRQRKALEKPEDKTHNVYSHQVRRTIGIPTRDREGWLMSGLFYVVASYEHGDSNKGRLEKKHTCNWLPCKDAYALKALKPPFKT